MSPKHLILKFHLPAIYPITDTVISGLSHAAQVEQLIDGGARFIQIREKTTSASAFYHSVSEALVVANDYGVKLIVNDRVDIALAVGADGVHLGQDDLPAEKARELMGEKAIIGISTHTIDQAIVAMQMPVDYIAFGPIFQTITKTDADPSVGLDELRHVREAIGIMPLVAIGGINSDNIASVISHGADSVAIISNILLSPNGIAKRFQELTCVINTAKQF